jgi:hypothetical protein
MSKLADFLAAIKNEFNALCLGTKVPRERLERINRVILAGQKEGLTAAAPLPAGKIQELLELIGSKASIEPALTQALIEQGLELEAMFSLVFEKDEKRKK